MSITDPSDGGATAPRLPYESTGRVDQKRRTRAAIKEAAARLAGAGAQPTMGDVAAACGMSRSSTYRYFPSLEALMAEIALDAEVSADVATIDAAAAAHGDAAERLAAVIHRDHEVVRQHERPFRAGIRAMLAEEAADDRTPRRPGNRLRYLGAAVSPLAHQVTPAQLDRLVNALALVVGIESRIVLGDIAGLDDREAEEVKQWAAAALLAAAREGAPAQTG